MFIGFIEIVIPKLPRLFDIPFKGIWYSTCDSGLECFQEHDNALSGFVSAEIIFNNQIFIIAFAIDVE